MVSIFWSTGANKPSKKGCFTGSSLVVLENGSPKKMSDLQVGDSVLTVSDNNVLSFSPIILNLHRSPKEFGEFLVLQTNTGHSLTLSLQHLLYIKPKNTAQNETEQDTDKKAFRPVFASSVKKGDSLLVYDKYNALKLGVVVNMEQMAMEGLYSPLTIQGNIIVDDVLASCYSDFDSHGLQHLSFAPFRWMYRLFELASPKKPKLINVDSSTIQDENVVHWYAQGLHVLSNLLFPWKLWGGYPLV